MTGPPGWPKDLDPPESGRFAEQVGPWLLYRAPGGWRRHPVLRNQPVALATLVEQHQAALLDGLRESYRAARRLLHDVLTPQAMADLLVALEAEGAETAETLREVTMVREALEGRIWRPRL